MFNDIDKPIRKIVYNPKDKLNAFVGFLAAESPLDEEWRELKIGHGFYMVSSKGRVLSLYNNIPRLLKQSKINGYYYVKIDGEMKRVNRLVAQAFVSNPNGLPVCHHIDACKTNNDTNNLKWVSYSENTKEHWKRKKEGNNGSV